MFFIQVTTGWPPIAPAAVTSQGIDLHVQHDLAVLRALLPLQGAVMVAGGEEMLRHLDQRIGPRLAVSLVTLNRNNRF